jgi:hypothetical protein
MIVKPYKLQVLDCSETQVEDQQSKETLKLYHHQAILLDEWKEHETFLLVTKTGTGKTIGAILPLLFHPYCFIRNLKVNLLALLLSILQMS